MGQAVVNGHESQSFDDFYWRDYRQLFGLAYLWTGSHWAAEDLVHEAFTEAHRRWESVGRYEDPGAWVRRVMFNKRVSRFRRLRVEAAAMARIGARSVEAPIELRPQSDEILDAVRTLPRRQAQAIALRYWEDRSVAEIAEILGCSLETAKTHLKRGRATLSDRLDHHREER